MQKLVPSSHSCDRWSRLAYVTSVKVDLQGLPCFASFQCDADRIHAEWAQANDAVEWYTLLFPRGAWINTSTRSRSVESSGTPFAMGSTALKVGGFFPHVQPLVMSVGPCAEAWSPAEL